MIEPKALDDYLDLKAALTGVFFALHGRGSVDSSLQEVIRLAIRFARLRGIKLPIDLTA